MVTSVRYGHIFVHTLYLEIPQVRPKGHDGMNMGMARRSVRWSGWEQPRPIAPRGGLREPTLVHPHVPPPAGEPGVRCGIRCLSPVLRTEQTNPIRWGLGLV